MSSAQKLLVISSCTYLRNLLLLGINRLKQSLALYSVLSKHETCNRDDIRWLEMKRYISFSFLCKFTYGPFLNYEIEFHLH